MSTELPGLERLTTEYVELEDRLCLRGEDAEGRVHAFWLTQRLSRRLLPVLLRWLEGETPADPAHAAWLQGFAQDAARAHFEPQPPVPPGPAQPAWLAAEIDLRTAAGALALTVRGARPGEAARLDFGAQALRQWLDIVRRVWDQAGWPASDWPAWMAPSPRQVAPSGQALH